MGEVYRATDTNLARQVAIKVLPEAVASDTERLARFEREAKTLASLNHPNIAQIYGLEKAAGILALVMELVEGGPLSARIPRRGLQLKEALKLAVQIASGLEAAHQTGIVHRDLKPGNVIVTPTGVVKLVDFGLAKLADVAGPLSDEAETISGSFETAAAVGQIRGTIAYMSPEQAQAQRIDQRSDLFSFGTLFYEMLTGTKPFRGENSVSTLSAILQQEPTPPSELTREPLPREVERLVLRCLRKDLDLIRFRGHLPKGGYDVQTDGRHPQAPAAPAIR
jgi:serine/threonine protein kinase